MQEFARNKNMSEDTIVRTALARLETDFHIQSKPKGDHFSGKELEIDAILRPKDLSEWKNKNVAMGIEFKDHIKFATNFDTKDYTKWLAQCVDYSHTYWRGYGYIYVFAFDGLVKQLTGTVYQGVELFLPHMMAHLGIGEVKPLPYHGLTFLLNGSHRVWSEIGGVADGKRMKLKREFGSR